MAEKKKARKPRAKQYDPKVKFSGTLENMIKMAATTKQPKKSAKKADK